MLIFQLHLPHVIPNSMQALHALSHSEIYQVNYNSMLGSLLMYASIATRPDIAQAVEGVSKFNTCPTEAHSTAVKQIFRSQGHKKSLY